MIGPENNPGINIRWDQCTVSLVILNCADGYNVSLLAYGQTGSGKTYTMIGPENNPGINIRWDQCTVNLVTLNCADGYNVSLLAYGQTGSGKTYTMIGPENNPGINIRWDQCTVYGKTCVKLPFLKRPKIGFQDQLLLNAGEHSAIISSFIKLPFVIKILVLSIFERLLYTGF